MNHQRVHNYNMVLAQTKDSSWCSKHTNPPNSHSSVWDAPYRFDKGLLAKRSASPCKFNIGLLAKRSATIASLLESNPCRNLSTFMKEIPSDPETLRLILRFCQGFDVDMKIDNILPLICLAHYLEMTETHSPGNLLDKAIIFLQDKILPSWDQTVRSLQALSGPVFQQAVDNGLLNLCIEGLTACAQSDPTLLGQPIMSDYANNSTWYMNNGTAASSRKLFADADHSDTSLDFNASFEDLTSLPVKMYEPIIKRMAQGQVKQEKITGSLYQYFKKHATDVEAIEAIERLLPASTCTTKNKYPLYPYTLLFEMYASAVFHGASSECIASLENRIGKELHRATAKDLLALDLDVESVRHILKGYYANFTDNNPSGLVAVAELMEKYLVEVVKEREIDVRNFIELAEMTSSILNAGSYLCSDGIYRAVDVYLDKQRELSESEKDEVCQVLDFQKMSPEACKHAAMNQKLPLRVVVQVLFEFQLQLQENISKAVVEYPRNSNVKELGKGSAEIKVVDDEHCNNEREEIGECHEKNCCGKKNKKAGLWKGMKRKFGCMRSTDYENLHGCNCQVTKNKKNKKELPT